MITPVILVAATTLLTTAIAQPPTQEPPAATTPAKVAPPEKTPPKPKAPTSKYEQLDPKSKLADAKPGVVYQATSQCTGYTEDGQDRIDLLKYCWSVPEGFERNKPRDMVIILPGFDMDCTWGPAALPARDLAPSSIVITVDGSRETDRGGRFPGLEIGDIILMRDFVLEMTRAFPTAKIILVGHSQGAFAQVMLANRFPRLFNGVVSCNGGVIHMPIGGLRNVPAVFIHGTDDDIVPLRASVQGRDALVSAGSNAAVYRPVPGAGHAPDVKQAAIGVAWIRGMVTEKPDEALDAALAMLAAPGDEGPAFGLAAQLCRRFAADPEDRTAWPRGLKEATDEQRKQARSIQLAIEAQALRHVAALRPNLPNAQALRSASFEADLPAPAWLGHLLALRENFRGVESVEAFATEIGFDDLADEQDGAGRRVVEVLESADWGGTGASPAETYAAVIENLPKAYLINWLPGNLEKEMRTWLAVADDLRLSKAQRSAFPVVTQYAAAIKQGREQYRRLNAGWKP